MRRGELWISWFVAYRFGRTPIEIDGSSHQRFDCFREAECGNEEIEEVGKTTFTLHSYINSNELER